MDKATPELVQLGLNMTNYDQFRTLVSQRCATLANIVQRCTDVGQHSPIFSTLLPTVASLSLFNSNDQFGIYYFRFVCTIMMCICYTWVGGTWSQYDQLWPISHSRITTMSDVGQHCPTLYRRWPAFSNILHLAPNCGIFVTLQQQWSIWGLNSFDSFV